MALAADSAGARLMIWQRALTRALSLRPGRVLAGILLMPFIVVGFVAAVVWFVLVAGVLAGLTEGFVTARQRLKGGDDADRR